VAVAVSMLTATTFMLRDGMPSQDLGPDSSGRFDRSNTITRLVRKLEDLGCEVELKKAAPPRRAAHCSLLLGHYLLPVTSRTLDANAGLFRMVHFYSARREAVHRPSEK
jgi:hypothetical protein